MNELVFSLEQLTVRDCLTLLNPEYIYLASQIADDPHEKLLQLADVLHERVLQRASLMGELALLRLHYREFSVVGFQVACQRLALMVLGLRKHVQMGESRLDAKDIILVVQDASFHLAHLLLNIPNILFLDPYLFPFVFDLPLEPLSCPLLLVVPVRDLLFLLLLLPHQPPHPVYFLHLRIAVTLGLPQLHSQIVHFRTEFRLDNAFMLFQREVIVG